MNFAGGAWAGERRGGGAFQKARGGVENKDAVGADVAAGRARRVTTVGWIGAHARGA